MTELADQIKDIAREVRWLGGDDNDPTRKTIFSTLYDIGGEVAALQAERDGLREALQPFVYLWRDISLDNQPDAAPMLVLYGAVIVAAHIKAARRALGEP